MSDPEIPINNSAGRLVNFLQKARSISLANRNTGFISVVGKVIKTPSDDYHALETVSVVFTMIRELEFDIKKLPPIKQKNYAIKIRRLKQVISQTAISGRYSSQADLTNPESDIFTTLGNCAYDLGLISEERVIESEELKKLQEEFRSLYDKIDNSKINIELKFVLLKQINTLLEKIENYQFLGSEAIKKESGAIFGSIFFNQEKINKPEEINIVKELLEMVFKLSGIANNAKNLIPEDWQNNIAKLLSPRQ